MTCILIRIMRAVVAGNYAFIGKAWIEGDWRTPLLFFSLSRHYVFQEKKLK